VIIPYGHEHTTVRRLPWVTFTLMALCVLAFVFTSVTHRDETQVVVDRLGEFFEYLGAHPYLEIDPEFEEFIFQFVPEDEFKAYLEVAKQFGASEPVSRRRLESEQDTLDAIMARIMESLDEAKQSPYYRFGLVPADAKPHAYITYQFLHGGFLHLFGNLFFLFLAGPFIEDVWGRPIFAAFYLTAGALSGFMFAVHYPQLDAPLIGASGAVAGVMGAFLVRYWKTKIRFFYWFGVVFTGTFSAPAWLMLPLWFLRELLVAQAWDVVTPGSAGSGVAHWAHVWGFGFGLMVAGGIAYWRIEERFIHRAIESKITLMDNTGVEEAMTVAEADPERAIRLLERELTKQPANVDAAMAMWTLARRIGQPEIAATSVVGVLEAAAKSGDEELVVAEWQDLMHAVPDLELSPALGARFSEILQRAGRPEGARDTIELTRRFVNEQTPTGIRVRLARLACSLGVTGAAAMVDEVLTAPDLPPEARAELDDLRSTLPDDAPLPEEPEPDPGSGVALDLAVETEHTLQVMQAVPTSFEDEVLTIEVGGASRRMSLNQVEAVAVGGVNGENGRRVLVVDLMLDPPWSDREALRVVRILSTAFDPRGLAEGADAMEAFRTLLHEIIETSGAAPLPDPESARGRPFKSFPSLDHYQREVLGVA
jgi:membrane associated rhomboid family serine protease